LEATWFSRLIYSKSLGTNLKKILVRHLDAIHQFPDTRLAQALPPVLEQSRLTGIGFDTLISMRFGGSSPPFPFSDVQAYYAHASSHEKIDAIRIPFLAFNAGDDPIAPWAPQGYDHNEWFTLVVTCGGGHLGWFQSGGRTDRWPKRPALEWFKATAEDVILGPRNVPAIEWKDGWLVEVGKEHLGFGCREIGDGGTFQGATRKAGDLLAGL
jgi:predicted alpha/beta-fold hydrolase